MTSDQLINVGAYLLAAVIGAVIHRFAPALLKPSTPSSPPSTPSSPPSKDRPILDVLTQLLAQLLNGGLIVPTPATVPQSPSAAVPSPLAVDGVSGSSASLLLTTADGRHIVLPLGSGGTVPQSTPATTAGTSTG